VYGFDWQSNIKNALIDMKIELIARLGNLYFRFSAL
jgi:hypothetical protein